MPDHARDVDPVHIYHQYVEHGINTSRYAVPDCHDSDQQPYLELLLDPGMIKCIMDDEGVSLGVLRVYLQDDTKKDGNIA